MIFVCTQSKCQTVLFEPLIGPFQELLVRARVDMGAMEMDMGALLEPRPKSG